MWKVVRAIPVLSVAIALALPSDMEALADNVVEKYEQLETDWADDFQGPVSAHEFGLALGQFFDVRTGGDLVGFTERFATEAHLYFREVEEAPELQPPN